MSGVPAGVRSLAWRTDLALLLQSGSLVEQRDDVVVVRTSANPGFHWGNFLLLPQAPGETEAQSWLDRFGEVLPGIDHRAIGVDDPQASASDLAPLQAVGLTVERHVTLTAAPGDVARSRAPAVDVRRLSGDADWAARTALTLARYPGSDPAYVEFVQRREASERRACAAGHGAWWGAFDGDAMLSGLGIFTAGDGLARYQDVVTRPGAERGGLASALIGASARWAHDRWAARRLVLVADDGSGALRLYRRLGFHSVEVQGQAFLAAPAPGASASPAGQ